MKSLIAENPYLPTAGINPDANGLIINKDEAVDMLNLRVTSKEILTRGGTRPLGNNYFNTDPIIASHTFKKPNGEEILFGFTKNMIWEYKESAGYWDCGVKKLVVDDCDTLDPITSKPLNWYKYQFGGWIPCLVGAPFDGTYSAMSTIITSGYNADGFYVYKKNGLSLDLSSYNAFAFMIRFQLHYKAGVPDNVGHYKIRFYSDDACTTEIESGFNTADRTIEYGKTYWHPCIVKFTNPANYTSVKAFIITYYTADPAFTSGPLVIIDNVYALKVVTNDVTFWHTTNFQDNTIGSTIVAAGSRPLSINEAESDGEYRCLLQYDPSAGYFKDLVLNNQVATVDEDSGAKGPTSDTGGVKTGKCSKIIGTTAIPTPGTDTLVAGTFAIYSAEAGIIATSSAIVNSGGTGKYALIPSDATHVTVGANTYVAETGEFSIAFTGSDFKDQVLFIYYTTNTVADIWPRYVWNFHGRLLLGNTYEVSTYYPWRIRATDIGKISTVPGINYWDLLNDDISPIMGGDYLGTNLVIYKQNSIVKGNYIGDPLIFNFDTAWKDGTICGRTIQTRDQRQYFLSRHDVCCFDGASVRSITQANVPLTTMTEKNIGYSRVRDSIFSALNIEELNACFANMYTKYNEYWLWIVKTGEVAPSAVYVYNIQRDVWYYFQYTSTCCTGSIRVNGASTWGDLSDSWDNTKTTWNAGSLSGTDSNVILYQNGYNATVDDNKTTDNNVQYTTKMYPNDVQSMVDIVGDPIPTRLITKDFVWGDISREDRCIRCDIEAQGTSMDVSVASDFSIDPAGFKQKLTMALSTSFDKIHYNPDVLGYHHRFCIESIDQIAIRWIIPYAMSKKLLNQ